MVPQVMIILGSASDKEIARKTTDILDKLEITYSLKVSSAHRTHNLTKELVKKGTEAEDDCVWKNRIEKECLINRIVKVRIKGFFDDGNLLGALITND